MLAVTMTSQTAKASLLTDFSSWLKDNEPYFGTNALRASIGPLYSRGREVGSQNKVSDTFGGLVNVGYSLDDAGQVNVGFFAAYFNEQVFDGTLKAELGKTFTVLGQKFYVLAGGGPAINIAEPDNILGVGYTGLVWKHDIVKAREGTAPWTLYTSYAAAKASNWEGIIHSLNFGVSHRF